MSEEEQSLEAVRAEVAQLHQRMEEIRASTEETVLKAWTSPWKNADTVKAKVDARLASNQEFRQIMTRAREAEARQSELAPDTQSGAGKPAGGAQGGHPAVR